MSRITPGRLLRFTAVVEAATGLVVIAMPALAVRLLLGLELSIDGALLARAFGITLLSLALSCWPGADASVRSPGFVGMLIYNVLISLYLGCVAALGFAAGPLLWPAVGLHAVVSGLQIFQWPAFR